MSLDEQYAARETEDMVFYQFECPGCGSSGELGLEKKDQFKPLGCPEDCGATFIQWRTNDGRMALRCVVQPIFEEK